MAEFTEVMRQINRLCSHYQDCVYSCCPLSNDCGTIGDYSSNAKQAMRIEKTVMEWAAEHPEPAYPTWEQYLVDLMTADMMANKTDNPNSVENYMRKTPIPADIAEKLGIEPKGEL